MGLLPSQCPLRQRNVRSSLTYHVTTAVSHPRFRPSSMDARGAVDKPYIVARRDSESCPSRVVTSCHPNRSTQANTDSQQLLAHQITMKGFLSAAALSLAVSDVSAHYIFQQLTTGGTKHGVFQYIRQNSNYNSPVTDLTSNDLRCNVGASGSGTETVTVKAGDSFVFSLDTPVYHQGPISM